MRTLKIGISLAALAAAAAITLLFGSRDAPIPNTEESRTQWMCSACRYVFPLTAQEVSQAVQAEPSHGPPLRCRKCNERTAYQAMTCPICGTHYLGAEAPGWSGECPTCKPEARSPEVVEETAPEPGAPRPKPQPKSL